MGLGLENIHEIQKVSSNALYGGLMEFGKSLEHIIVINQDLVDVFEPKDDNSDKISSRHNFIVDRRRKVEEKKLTLAQKLIEISKNSHYKPDSQYASRCPRNQLR